MELKIEHVKKEFKDITAVNDVSYSMHSGVYGLLGVNGAGKTTLMRMLCTLLKPTEGRITWNGEDIFDMKGEYRKLLGYLPQDFGFYPDFTVKEYLMYISSIKGLKPATAKKRTEAMIHKVGLSKAARKKMKTLSGGMKRRAGIAQAMLNNPKILVLDEPTAGLDPNERIRFRNLISELSTERLVLLSTHIVSDIEGIAKELLLMKEGEIKYSGTPEQIIASIPEHVWRVTVPRKYIEAVLKKYKVANVKNVPGGAEVSILSVSRPFAEAVEEEVTLEDVFLYYFGEKAGGEYDVL